jgi:hypothetical protein
VRSIAQERLNDVAAYFNRRCACRWRRLHSNAVRRESNPPATEDYA